jgi:hypothetical protein
MTQIQITDLDFCEYELTDKESLEINGGSFWRDLNRAFNRALRNSGGIAIGITIPILTGILGGVPGRR